MFRVPWLSGSITRVFQHRINMPVQLKRHAMQLVLRFLFSDIRPYSGHRLFLTHVLKYLKHTRGHFFFTTFASCLGRGKNKSSDRFIDQFTTTCCLAPQTGPYL